MADRTQGPAYATPDAVTADDAVAGPRAVMLRSQNGVQEVGEQSDTENDCRHPGYFEDGNPDICHAPSLAAVGRRP
jgi:hypothetical protein